MARSGRALNGDGEGTAAADRGRTPAADGAGTAALRGALLVVAAACLWGSLGLYGRFAFRHGVSPLDVASVRAAIAFLGVLPFLGAQRWRRRGRPTAGAGVPTTGSAAADAPGGRPAESLPASPAAADRAPAPAGRGRFTEIALLFAYGAISIGLFYYLYMTAIERLPLAVAAALLYTAPAFVVAIAWTMGWERFDARRLVPLAMVLAGAALVTGVLGDIGEVTLAGAAFGVGSGITYAVFTAMGKRVRRRRGTLATTAWAYGGGAAVLAVVAPPWAVLTTYPSAWPVLLLMGVFATLLPTLLFYVGIRFIDASAASMLTTIEPVVAAALGFAFLGEGITGSMVVGTALIVGAALRLARRPVVG